MAGQFLKQGYPRYFVYNAFNRAQEADGESSLRDKEKFPGEQQLSYVLDLLSGYGS